MSVGQIVDEVSRYVKDGQGADMARNFGRQVRDNPLALALVGAGMAWLMVGQGARAEGRRLKGRYDDWRDDDEYDDYDPYEYGYSDAGTLDTEYSERDYAEPAYSTRDAAQPGAELYGAAMPAPTSHPARSGSAVSASEAGGPGERGP